MILATHNSLSSYHPKKWWMALLNPFARCQSLSIEEQYAKGVRMFDIRVIPHTGEAAHGLIKYDVDIENILMWLNKTAMKLPYNEKIYVRLCCESSNSDVETIIWFHSYFSWCRSKFENIVFCGGYIKDSWTKIIDVRDPEYLELYRTFNCHKNLKGLEKVKSILEYILHPTPKYWANKDNSLYIDKYNSYNGYIMLDFV